MVYCAILDVLGIRSCLVRFDYAVRDHFHVYHSVQTSSTVTPIITVVLTCFGDVLACKKMCATFTNAAERWRLMPGWWYEAIVA